MNKYLIPVLFISLVTIGVIGLMSTSDELQPITISDAIYCGADGELTDEQPIQSHRSYCVKSNAGEIEIVPNTPVKYAFSIVDDRGDTLKEFVTTHTKPMHVIIVRKDLQHFQHLHPEFNARTGEFTLPDLVFAESGQYRIFADFAPAGGMRDPHGEPLPVTLAEDVKVSGKYAAQEIGAEDRTRTFGEYQVTVTATDPLEAGTSENLTFIVTKNGEPVEDLEEYLGALGHSVILREGTLDFIHTHPLESAPGAEPLPGTIDFAVTFPDAGLYKVFTQFQHDAVVTTTDFVVLVQEGAGMPSSDMDQMPSMHE